MIDNNPSRRTPEEHVDDPDNPSNRNTRYFNVDTPMVSSFPDIAVNGDLVYMYNEPQIYIYDDNRWWEFGNPFSEDRH